MGHQIATFSSFSKKFLVAVLVHSLCSVDCILLFVFYTNNAAE